MQRNQFPTQEEKLLISSIGNLVLLCDHAEGCNKIQDSYKNELFVIESKHQDLNVYIIKPPNSKWSYVYSESAAVV